MMIVILKFVIFNIAVPAAKTQTTPPPNATIMAAVPILAARTPASTTVSAAVVALMAAANPATSNYLSVSFGLELYHLA